MNIRNWLSALGVTLCAVYSPVQHVTAQDAQQLPSLGDATSGLISLQEEKALGESWLRNLSQSGPKPQLPVRQQRYASVPQQPCQLRRRRPQHEASRWRSGDKIADCQVQVGHEEHTVKTDQQEEHHPSESGKVKQYFALTHMTQNDQ